ncbi:ABC-F family ATP-binding cassette domain-containing protein [Neobacillus sp. WH10]|uniref:ABC-F family ATP-binding cassette domain-containing protein n=1 Tax=Neobacillus sp. WH10 TaxID=3047873 RepID=UPI0024C1D206|nr:ABC-F family ATP-binding cassette domain-containing protein [Neobacillus sp. WH10]WHY77071.1 ABC-F family ATP-binding cassette domain-containing protein [Neobacillus sp. WH10]
MSLLEVRNLTHRFIDKPLYDKASFDLYKGEHMGIVGQNGAGKSTLIKILMGEIIPDNGMIKWKRDIRIGHLDQYAEINGTKTIIDYLNTAFANLFELEKKLNDLYQEMVITGNYDLMEQAAKYQEKLETSDFYLIESHIDKVVYGLGINAIGIECPIQELSGGQRAKVILAKLLLEKPHVLLLDEPTNFLDKEHVDWLANYLTVFDGAYIVVSHDFDFLEKISSCICDIELGTIKKYTGKYSDFLRQKEHLREDYTRQYVAQQKKIEKTEEFIRKNIAGVNSKMAQGRRKQLERMERMAPPVFTHKPAFSFKEISLSAQMALRVNDLEVGYGKPLLPKLNFTVSGGQKLVITGFNGIGKSTLLKTLVQRISIVAGSFQFAESVKIGYFEQNLTWEDKAKTPLKIISDFYPKLGVKEIRSRLAQCGLKNAHTSQAIGTLSGGEQSKVKLCLLLLSSCNFLVLDEPTNHLDAETKEALQKALIQFKGSVLLVSHEEKFYQTWADRYLNIEDCI